MSNLESHTMNGEDKSSQEARTRNGEEMNSKLTSKGKDGFKQVYRQGSFA